MLFQGIVDFPESYFEDDPVTTPVAELCTWPVVESVNLPLPELVSYDSDRESLEAETKSDSSLEHVGSLAETGDGVEEDVLVQYACHSSNQGVVVPTGRSHQVSTLAPVADIHRVATMNEEESVCETPSGLTVGKEEFVPSVPDQAQVDKVVDECVVVPSSESVSTGVHEPVPIGFHLGGRRKSGCS